MGQHRRILHCCLSCLMLLKVTVFFKNCFSLLCFRLSDFEWGCVLTEHLLGRVSKIGDDIVMELGWWDSCFWSFFVCAQSYIPHYFCHVDWWRTHTIFLLWAFVFAGRQMVVDMHQSGYFVCHTIQGVDNVKIDKKNIGEKKQWICLRAVETFLFIQSGNTNSNC